MRKEKRKTRDEGPIVQNACFVRDPATDADRVFVEKALISLKNTFTLVREFGGVHDGVIEGVVSGLPRTGRARLVYRTYDGASDVYSLTIWDNPEVPDEFTEMDYFGLSFKPGSVGYETLAEIEKGYQARLRKEAAEKAARRAARNAGILKAAGVVK